VAALLFFGDHQINVRNSTLPHEQEGERIVSLWKWCCAGGIKLGEVDER
jgi:hypothetical protein